MWSYKRVIISTLVLLGLAIASLIYIAVSSNGSRSKVFEPNLTKSSHFDLNRLQFCEASNKTEVPAQIIAGVVLAEKQLNRDWTDFVQDRLFTIFYYLLNDAWWDQWSNRSMMLASENLKSREVSSDWAKNVAWTGIIFSVGPSQITPRTALLACRYADKGFEWCKSTKLLIKGLLSESESLEIAGLILDFERKNHLQKTGIDISRDPGKWVTLYNFGGDIFRARFKDDPNRGPNRFGRWVEGNLEEMESLLSCKNW